MENFSDIIKAAASKAEKFGTRKAYIASVYDNMPARYRECTSLEHFKKVLRIMMRSGSVFLLRGDLVGAMNREMLDRSEIQGQDGCECYHFVEV